MIQKVLMRHTPFLPWIYFASRGEGMITVKNKVCADYCLLFDLDGTLVDSMPSISDVVIHILRECDISFPENIIEIVVPMGYIAMHTYFVKNMGMKLTQKHFIELVQERLYEKYRDHIPLKEGVYEYLSTMKNKGVRLSVLSGSPHKMLDSCLKRLGIYHMFEHVWSCEDFETTKDNPEIFRRIAECLQLDLSDIVLFDDNIGVIKTANAVGIYTVGLYDDAGKNFEVEMKNIADVYVRSFNELNNNAVKMVDEVD